MWWLTHARLPRARQNVFLSSAPHASSGRGVPRRAATARRERSRGSAGGGRAAGDARTTESSVRVWIGRSWTRNRSAIPRSRSTASSSPNAIGSSDTLALVITSVVADVGQKQVVEWGVGQHHAELGRPGRDRVRHRPPLQARGEHDRARRRGQERAPGRERDQSFAPSSSDGAINANGLSSRCLRVRSDATACSSPARQARW